MIVFNIASYVWKQLYSYNISFKYGRWKNMHLSIAIILRWTHNKSLLIREKPSSPFKLIKLGYGDVTEDFYHEL